MPGIWSTTAIGGGSSCSARFRRWFWRLAIAFVLRDPVPPERVPFDYIGAMAIAGTFLCLQYVVNEGERRNWGDDPWIVAASVATCLGGAATLVWKLRFSPHPFLDFRVLRHRN